MENFYTENVIQKCVSPKCRFENGHSSTELTTLSAVIYCDLCGSAPIHALCNDGLTNYACINCEDIAKEGVLHVMRKNVVAERQILRNIRDNEQRIAEKFSLQSICKRYEFEDAYWFYCDEFYCNNEKYIQQFFEQRQIDRTLFQNNDICKNFCSVTKNGCARALISRYNLNVVRNVKLTSKKRGLATLTKKKQCSSRKRNTFCHDRNLKVLKLVSRPSF